MSIEAMKQVIELYDKHCYNNDYGGIEFNKNHGYKFIESIEALRTAIQQAESEPVGAREALERIASWSEHPAMLGVDYGSNGVRDYYRKIARNALTHPAPGVPDDVVRDAERYRWLRDHDHWPAPFSSSQAPEPVRGRDLDSNIDAAMLAASS